MDNKHLKSFSTSLVMRKMQNKIDTIPHQSGRKKKADYTAIHLRAFEHKTAQPRGGSAQCHIVKLKVCVLFNPASLGWRNT